MLRISKKADYAVFLLGAIARQGAYPGGPAGDAVVSAHEIARQAGLNKSVVANLLKEFARSGLLESTRGLKGGYRLGRAPSRISLGDILEVVEGKFVLVDCVAHRERDHAPLPPTGAEPPALLALAPSMHREPGQQRETSARRQPPAPATPECALIAFCPSKQPMRLVHQRISRLFQEILLDELCALPTAGQPTAGQPTAGQPTAAGTARQQRLQSTPR